MDQPETGGGFGADAVVHFGMHGTEEWLPGTHPFTTPHTFKGCVPWIPQP